MSMPRFDGWSYYGPAVVVTSLPTGVAAITASRATTADIVIRVPRDCQIESIEAYLTDLAGGPATATISVWRDAARNRALIGDGPAAATQTITLGTTTATDGSVVWSVFKDHHPLEGVSVLGTTAYSETGLAGATGPQLPAVEFAELHVHIVLNAGTARLVGLMVNWRA